jgi:hypothetical protein
MVNLGTHLGGHLSAAAHLLRRVQIQDHRTAHLGTKLNWTAFHFVLASIVRNLESCQGSR